MEAVSPQVSAISSGDVSDLGLKDIKLGQACRITACGVGKVAGVDELEWHH